MERAGTTGPRIRVAIVGTGFAGASHVDALSRVRDVEVAGVVGSSRTRAEEAAARFGLERAYADLDELLADGSVEAIHNCTPNDLHATITIAALDAGKHVLSEKPLGIDPHETAELAKRARATDLVTGVCFNYRHFPLVQQMRSMIGAGADAPVHLVRGAYLQDWLLHDDDWSWRVESARAGRSRAVGDIGSHLIDLLQHVTGRRVVAVSADLGRLHDERWRPAGPAQTFGHAGGERERVAVDTEDHGSVLLRLENGEHGVITVSQVSPGSKNRLWLEVDAARASYRWDQEEPNRLRVGRRDGADLELVRDPSLLAPEAAALVRFPGGHQEGWPDALRNLVADFSAAIRARGADGPHRPTFASFEDAHRVVQVVDAIVTSDRSRSWVDVGASPDHQRIGHHQEVST